MTKAQEDQIERLKSCPYLGGDVWTKGKGVAAELRKNRLLWDAFVIAPRHDLGILYELLDMAVSIAKEKAVDLRSMPVQQRSNPQQGDRHDTTQTIGL